MIEREKMWYILSNLNGIGPVSIRRLLEYAGDVETLFSMSDEEVALANILTPKMLGVWKNRRNTDAYYEDEFEHLQDKKIIFVSEENADYPKNLMALSDRPTGIYYIGRNVNEYQHCAAIIGSRGCSAYGRELATQIGKFLSEIGVCVVSGMALGIDAAGQLGAINNNGDSVGVLGSGVNVCYPMENKALYERLKECGTIISEQPINMKGLPQNFVLRNRIISGLSDCVIVVEARKKSGTQITVTHSLNQGKEIFCVPGRITDPMSLGCNEMISQGARILYDLKELAEFFHSDEIRIDRMMVAELSELERFVFSRMGDDIMHIEDIITATSLPVSDVMTILLNLEIKGLIHEQIRNYYRRVVKL